MQKRRGTKLRQKLIVSIIQNSR